MQHTGIIFKRTLYDNRRSIFWWGAGLSLMALYVVFAYPLIEGLEEFSQILDNPVFQVLLGDAGGLDWTSPEGFLGIEFFSWIPLILAVYAVLFGINMTAGEESNGTIDLLLSTPTPRWQVILEKYAAYIVAVSLILLITAVFMWVSIFFTPEMSSISTDFAWGLLNILPVMLVICSLALLLATIMRAPGQAGGITAGIIVASYFLNSIGDMSESAVIKGLQQFSFYKYHSPFNVLSEGINWGYFSMLLVISGIFLALAMYCFERRDVYV